MIRPVSMPFRGCRNSIFQANNIIYNAKLLSYFCLAFFVVYISFPILWESTCIQTPLFSGPRLAFLNVVIMLPFIYEPLVTRATFSIFRKECSRDDDMLRGRVEKRVQKDFKIESPIKKDGWRGMVKKRGVKKSESEENKALEVASAVVISWLARRTLPSSEVKREKKYFSYEVFGYKRDLKFDKFCEFLAPYVVKPLFLGQDDGTVPCFSDPDDKAWKMAASLAKDLLLSELNSNNYMIPQLRTSLEEIITFLYIRALEVTAEALYRHRQQVFEITSDLLSNDCKIKDEMSSILEPLPKRKTSWFKKFCVFKDKPRSKGTGIGKFISKMLTAVGNVVKKKQDYSVVNSFK